MGKAALDGQTGIIGIENGWRKGREINRVIFNPAETTVRHIEEILKKSGIYIQTVAPPAKIYGK